MYVVVIRAIDRINQDIEKLSAKGGVGSDNCQELSAVRDGFEIFLSLVPSPIDVYRLFCRRLARLMDYNESFKTRDWDYLHKELLYVLQKDDGPFEEQDYTKFSSLLELEGVLQQREMQSRMAVGEFKNFHELVQIHRDFLDQYLRRCLSLHSKLEVKGLVENVEDLLRSHYQQNDIQLSSQTKDHLQTELRSIQVPLECPYRYLLQGCSMSYFSTLPSHEEFKDEQNAFLPGMEEMSISSDEGILEIYERLQESRWMVILGDMGSAKTTAMRLLTQLYSKEALGGNERVLIKQIDCGPVRIPILIRIHEFVEWLDAHPDMALIDYIGEQTWFSEPYNDHGGGCALKEFISHGHALILLDGLDEIPTIERRREIIKLVQQFIHEHVHGRDFVSAFDDVPGIIGSNAHVTQPSSMSGGNQIVVTSRVVGYSSNGLVGPLIRHYFVSPMSNTDANRFAQHWFQRVNQEVCCILSKEGVHLDSEKVNISKTKQENTLMNALSSARKELSLRPLMLSMICSCVFKCLDNSSPPESMVQLYHLTAQSAMHNWTSQPSTIPANVLRQFQTDLALYLHLHSSSGCIDEFDMKSLSYLVMKQQNLSHNNRELRRYANDLMVLISAGDGIVVERGLKVFSFIHLSLQEYFVALFLLRPSSIDVTVNNFLSFAIRPRFRESISLALVWISYMWPFENYRHFCERLIAPSADYAIPLGALLFLVNAHYLEAIPSPAIMEMAFDRLLDHSSDVIFIGYLGMDLAIVPMSTIEQWMRLRLTNEKNVVKFCKSLLHSITLIQNKRLWEKGNYEVLKAVCQRLWSFHTISLSVECCNHSDTAKYYNAIGSQTIDF